MIHLFNFLLLILWFSSLLQSTKKTTAAQSPNSKFQAASVFGCNSLQSCPVTHPQLSCPPEASSNLLPSSQTHDMPQRSANCSSPPLRCTKPLYHCKHGRAPGSPGSASDCLLQSPVVLLSVPSNLQPSAQIWQSWSGPSAGQWSSRSWCGTSDRMVKGRWSQKGCVRGGFNTRGQLQQWD